MAIDLTLLGLFLISAFLLWYKLSVKLPQLVAIPDQVITERFHEDSAKLRLFVLHLKVYYREKRYKSVFWRFVGKNLFRLHVLILRFDNWMVRILKSAKAKSEFIEGPEVPEKPEEASSVYWQKLNAAPEQPPSVPSGRKSRMEGVRKKADT